MLTVRDGTCLLLHCWGADREYSTSVLAPALKLADELERASIKVSEAMLAQVAEKAPPLPPCLLERLRFNGAFHIGDISMGYIAARCRRLKSISLKGCFDVTDVGLVELMQKCPLLEEILADVKFILPTQAHFREFGEGRTAALRGDLGIGGRPEDDGGTGASGGAGSHAGTVAHGCD